MSSSVPEATLSSSSRCSTSSSRRGSPIRARAERFPPERIAAATGIRPETLRELARDFAKAPRAACYVRVGTCHQEHATLASWLAYALAAVTGNMDREGGLMWTTPAADV